MLKIYSQQALLDRCLAEIVRFNKGIGDSFIVGRNTVEIYRSLEVLHVIQFALQLAYAPTQEYLFHIERKLDLVCQTKLPVLLVETFVSGGLIKVKADKCNRQVTDPLEEGDTTQGGGTLIFPELIFSGTPLLIEAGELFNIDLIGSWTDKGDSSTQLVNLKISRTGAEDLITSVVDPAEYTDPISLAAGQTMSYTLSGFWKNEAKGYPAATAFTEDKFVTVKSIVPMWYGKSVDILTGAPLLAEMQANGNTVLPLGFPKIIDYAFTTNEGDYVYLLIPYPAALISIIDNNDNEVVGSVIYMDTVLLTLGATTPYQQNYRIYRSDLPNAGGFDFNWKITVSDVNVPQGLPDPVV